MVEPICKELEIETETKMAKWLRQLLFQHNSFASKSFIMMYLNEPRTTLIHVLTIVHLEALDATLQGIRRVAGKDSSMRQVLRHCVSMSIVHLEGWRGIIARMTLCCWLFETQ
jgi:hypothetical protein